MADREALYNALRNAGAAGDTAAATRLAQYIKTLPNEQPARPLTPTTIDPTEGMTFTEKALSGAGKSLVDTASGLQQLGADIGEKMGLVSPQTVKALQNDETRRANLDNPLMHTGAGIFGNVVGSGLQMIAGGGATSKLPGAGAVVNKLAGMGRAGSLVVPAVGGAVYGGVQPVTDDNSRQKNMAVGAAGGAVGAVAAKVIGAGASALKNRLVDMATKSQTQNALRDAAAVSARDAGYVIPPSTTNPDSLLNQTLEGISGKIKTAQYASAKNQDVTNSLAKKAVGLAEDEPLTVDALSNIRKAAGQQYEAVRDVGPMQTDQHYFDAIDAIEKQFKGANASFPGITSPDVSRLLEPLRQPGFNSGDAIDAVRVLRDVAESNFKRGDTGLGKAAKGAAQALEDVIERNLSAAGNTDGLAAFRNARQLIAKTYTVQNALNPANGNVNAQALAAALKKGKPLTGDLRTVAEASGAFRKAMQPLNEAPLASSPLDWWAGAGTALGTQNPLGLGAMAVRPAIRNALLSNAYQKTMGTPSYGSPMTNKLLDLAKRVSAGPVLPVSGVAGGLVLAK